VQISFVCTHPSFFVSFSGRAVKPNRLLFPALAPAVRVGLRLLCAGRASARESVRGILLLRAELPGLPVGLALLLRPQAEPAGFAVRAPGALDGRLLLPLGRAPLLEPVLEWVPLRLPLVPVAPFALQRAPLAGREPLAVRAPAGRESELLRRAGRLLVAVAAGLRSRV
jgi:hypothetical protein